MLITTSVRQRRRDVALDQAEAGVDLGAELVEEVVEDGGIGGGHGAGPSRGCRGRRRAGAGFGDARRTPALLGVGRRPTALTQLGVRRGGRGRSRQAASLACPLARHGRGSRPRRGSGSGGGAGGERGRQAQRQDDPGARASELPRVLHAGWPAACVDQNALAVGLRRPPGRPGPGPARSAAARASVISRFCSWVSWVLTAASSWLVAWMAEVWPAAPWDAVDRRLTALVVVGWAWTIWFCSRHRLLQGLAAWSAASWPARLSLGEARALMLVG